MIPIRITLFLIFITLLAASSCTTPQPQNTPPDVYLPPQQPLLNSERIRQQFGSYEIEVVQQDDRLRISNLYSIENGVKITRTLAIVFFPAMIPASLQAEQEQITRGQSIGEVFKKNGWQIEKQNVWFGEIDADPEFKGVYAAMGGIAATDLAIHIYRLLVSRNGQQHPYATLAEIHQPDYLELTELQKIYDQAEKAAGWTEAEVEATLHAVTAVMALY